MLIKLRYVHDNEPKGRDYSYHTTLPVAVGDTVNIDGKVKGLVTAINVPEEEVEAFKDKVKSIVGIFKEEN